MPSFEHLFAESKGQPVVWGGKTLRMMDTFLLPQNGCAFTFRFESTNSEWKQGISVSTKRGEVRLRKRWFGSVAHKGFMLWGHTAPKAVRLSVSAPDRKLRCYNIWQPYPNAIHAHHHGAAMIREYRDGRFWYRCNDGVPDEDFDDIVFSVESEAVPEDWESTA